jgi:hypothetical protein
VTPGPGSFGGPFGGLLDRLAIRRMGWAEPVFRGVERDERGKQEAYRILRPGRTLLRPRARAFDAIVVQPWARFGNAIVQIANAIEGAQRFGAGRILLPPGHPIFTVAVRVGRIECGYGDAGALAPDRTALVGRFFHARAVGARASTWSRREHAAHHIRGLIHPDVLAPDPRLGPDDVVAHLRSGDIFRPATPHVTYGQPPVSHYLGAIDASGARRAWIVYEDRANPAIAVLAQRLRDRGIEVIEQSATLAEDLRLMLSARRLVIGRSTLGDAVAALSRALSELYVFGAQRRILPSRSTVTQFRTVDVAGDYVAAVQSRNWRNTEEQRRMMVDYPAGALTIVREERGVGPAKLRRRAGSARTA